MLYMAERLGRSGRGLLTYGGSTAIAIIPSHPRQLPRPTEGPLSSYRVTLSSLFRYVLAIFHLRADHNEKGRTLRSTMCTSRRHGISMAANGTESHEPEDSTAPTREMLAYIACTTSDNSRRCRLEQSTSGRQNDYCQDVCLHEPRLQELLRSWYCSPSCKARGFGDLRVEICKWTW